MTPYKPFAKKSLGQNFLHNTEIRKRILEAAGDLKGKNILEIGPGLGFLTTKLVGAGANVIAVELDERAVKVLQSDFGHKPNFHLIQGDILKQDLDAIFEQKMYSIIANIPYNITSHLLRKLLAETKHKPVFALLMVQKEVAEKICETRKKSILSLSVEVFATAQILFSVPRENFTPVPKVDSSVIRFDMRTQPLVPEKMEKDFFCTLHAGFSQKRKKLGNVIGAFFGMKSEKLLGKIDPNRRAETLSIDEWIEITENFQRNNPLRTPPERGREKTK